MAGLSDAFYPSDLQTQKKLVRVGVPDIDLITKVFPESGVTTYLTVYLFHKLASRLRDEGITSYQDRLNKRIMVEDLKKFI